MSSEIRDINLAESGERKIEWVKRNCDLLRTLEKEFTESKPFAGKKVALSVHLEAKTAYLCLVLAAGGAEMTSMIVMLVAMVALMYFMIYRPQKKQQKREAEMRNSLEIGDEVTTIGGIIGRVVAMKDDTFVMETGSDRVKIRFRRTAIAAVNKLTLDGADKK